MTINQSIIIHGGCGPWNKEIPIELKYYNEKKKQLDLIIRKGWELLHSGASALDVAEKTINLLEDAPCFNAGIGACLDINKKVHLDASIMRGDTLAGGGIAELKNIPNAISVARKVMDETVHVLLVGEGANKFAKQKGFKTVEDEVFHTELQLYKLEKAKNKLEATTNTKEYVKGTVGCVVRDSTGLIVAGTSTGGNGLALQGRVGDSPIIGAGTYADNMLGGVSCTGYGEQIIRINMAKSSLDLMHYSNLTPMEACQKIIAKLGGLKDGLGGIIMINPQGDVGYACNDSVLPCAYMTSEITEPKIIMEI